ncbi:L,D-transpeptidase [Actinosynnema sp. NPDC047251]|nr:L,D-transpeptidase [Saccharothrix espanaensis]
MRDHDAHSAGDRMHRERGARRSPTGLLALQSLAGNAAVTAALQRCGPVRCDCNKDEKDAAVVQRDTKAKPRKVAGQDAPPLAQRGPMVTRIEVHLGTQQLVAHLNDGKSRSRQVSTGKGVCGTKANPCAEPELDSHDQCTPPGDFHVQSRRGGNWHGSDGRLTPDHAMGYYLGFHDQRGIGIHNTQTADGTPRSHGCVRLGHDNSPTGFAAWLNTHTPVGTPVVVDGVAAAAPYSCPAAKRPKKG